MNYVKIPNLPNNDVSTVFVSEDIGKEAEFSLNSYGIKTVKISPHPKLYNAVKTHPDMQLCHLGGNNIVCDGEVLNRISEISPIPNICLGSGLAENYPYDIRYNAARVGGYLICNKAYTEQIILDKAAADGVAVIDVRQGYAKCNICILTENAVITSDTGIKNTLEKYPVEVLLIEDSSVVLKDFNHGFLGGATGKISEDKLAVNGNIKYHKNGKEIINFAYKHNVEIVSLNNQNIEDIGSIIPILEK